VFAFGYFAWNATELYSFVILTALTGVCMSCWMITTHDAIHHTLTGINWVDEAVPRLISWPIIWVHGIYAEVHKVHHKMNGDDLNDPERVQWTREEYQAAGPVGRFYVRHQWFIDIFVFAGFGLIWKTVSSARQFFPKSKSMRRAVYTDFIGIVLLNILIYSAAIAQGAGLRWLVMWLVMERFSGIVLQWRAHVEHYGLWGKGRNYYETQLYACRNISTSAFGSWYFNRLNYHSVHHVFPKVPFYKLKTAHARFQDLVTKCSVEPLVQEKSYVRIAWRNLLQPSVIGPVDPDSASGRRKMLDLDELNRSAGF
jgi:fatty acid desaturase